MCWWCHWYALPQTPVWSWSLRWLCPGAAKKPTGNWRLCSCEWPGEFSRSTGSCRRLFLVCGTSTCGTFLGRALRSRNIWIIARISGRSCVCGIVSWSLAGIGTCPAWVCTLRSRADGRVCALCQVTGFAPAYSRQKVSGGRIANRESPLWNALRSFYANISHGAPRSVSIFGERPVYCASDVIRFVYGFLPTQKAPHSWNSQHPFGFHHFAWKFVEIPKISQSQVPYADCRCWLTHWWNFFWYCRRGQSFGLTKCCAPVMRSMLGP